MKRSRFLFNFNTRRGILLFQGTRGETIERHLNDRRYFVILSLICSLSCQMDDFYNTRYTVSSIHQTSDRGVKIQNFNSSSMNNSHARKLNANSSIPSLDRRTGHCNLLISVNNIHRSTKHSLDIQRPILQINL